MGSRQRGGCADIVARQEAHGRVGRRRGERRAAVGGQVVREHRQGARAITSFLIASLPKLG